MNRLHELQKADPVRSLDVELLSADPLFEELFVNIISGPSAVDASKVGEPVPDVRLPSHLGRLPEQLRHRQKLLVAAAAAVVLVAASFSITLGGSGTGGRATTAYRAARMLPSPGHFTSPRGLSGTWQLVGDVVGSGWQLNTSGPPPSSLTCPTTSACYALARNYASARGGSPLLSESLYVSSDFGVSWSVLPMPSGSVTTTPLSCSSAQTCSAGGVIKDRSIFMLTTDGGHQWTTTPLSGLSGALAELSCSSATNCHGILTPYSPPARATSVTARQEANRLPDESFVTTTNGGSSWTSRALPHTDLATDFTCYDASNCIVMGVRKDVAFTSLSKALTSADVGLRKAINNALNTSKGSILLPQYPIPAVFKARLAALPSAISHYEQTVVALHLPPAASREVASIVRHSAALREDLALNAVGKLPANRWNDDGTALNKAQQTTIEQLNVQTFVRSTTDGGATWTTGVLSVDDLGTSNTLSCSSASDCAALASPYTSPVLITTSDGGTTWQTRSFPPDIPSPAIAGVSCSSAEDCWVSGSEAVTMVIGNDHEGDSPLILGTTDGGLSWSKVTLAIPPNAPNPDGQAYQGIGPISCPTANACIALGGGARGAASSPIYSFVGDSSGNTGTAAPGS